MGLQQLVVLLCLAAVSAPTAHAQLTSLEVGTPTAVVVGGTPVWEVVVPAGKDLVATVTTSVPTLMHISAGSIPSTTTYDAMAWGSSTFSATLDSCVQLGTEFKAYIRLSCWTTCALASWQLTANTPASHNAPNPQFVRTISTESSAEVTVNLGAVKPGVMSYMYVLLPPPSQLRSRHLQVEVTSSAPVLVSASLYSGPASIFGRCVTLKGGSPVQRATMQAGDSAAIGLTSSASPHGVWLGVSSWAQVPALSLKVGWGTVTCSPLTTSVLPFCAGHLPSSILTPSTPWPNGVLGSTLQRDAIAQQRASGLGLALHGSQGPCFNALASRICSKSFPRCQQAENATALPVCAASCSAIHEGCEEVREAVPQAVAELEVGCSSAAATTCYTQLGAAASTTLRAAAGLVAVVCVLALL